jgi:hypothetical protein
MRVALLALSITAPVLQLAHAFTQLQLQWRSTAAVARSSSALRMHVEHVNTIAQVLHSFQVLLADSQTVEVRLTKLRHQQYYSLLLIAKLELTSNIHYLRRQCQMQQHQRRRACHWIHCQALSCQA